MFTGVDKIPNNIVDTYSYKSGTIHFLSNYTNSPTSYFLSDNNVPWEVDNSYCKDKIICLNDVNYGTVVKNDKTSGYKYINLHTRSDKNL